MSGNKEETGHTDLTYRELELRLARLEGRVDELSNQIRGRDDYTDYSYVEDIVQKHDQAVREIDKAIEENKMMDITKEFRGSFQKI